MKKPLWWILYKFAIVIFFLCSCALIAAVPPIGIIAMLIAFALWGAQSRREKSWREEQHNQNLVNALKNFPLDEANATWKEK